VFPPLHVSNCFISVELSHCTTSNDRMGCGASSAAAADAAAPQRALGRRAEIGNEYTLGQKLGEGAFATTHQAVRKCDGLNVAIKKIERNHKKFDLDLIEAEIKVMRQVTHERCIRLLDVVEDSSCLHLVEEVAAGGELFDRIVSAGHLTEKHTAHMIREVLEGLAHIHSVGAIHRDLKPENLLLMSNNASDEGYLEIKIADFGLAFSSTGLGHDLHTFCGTPDYLAPEMIEKARKHSNDEYDAKVRWGTEGNSCATSLLSYLVCSALQEARKQSRHSETPRSWGIYAYTQVDVWAVGVICYVMIAGYPPFGDRCVLRSLSLLRLYEVLTQWVSPKNPFTLA
jgi:serine/threonine protein kinase